MESSNTWCNLRRIIASTNGQIEMMKHHNETTNRCDQWWIELLKTTSWRGQPTNQTDKMTRQTHKAMSQLLKSASQTGNSLSRTPKTANWLEVLVCRNDETPWQKDESNILSTIYLHINTYICVMVKWIQNFGPLSKTKVQPKCNSLFLRCFH